MSTFDDRETAFEAKFAHDEEMLFNANARRNKQLGLWAAALKGETIEAARAYARSVVKSDLAKAGHEDVVEMVCGYLTGVADESTVRAKMDELMVAAKAEIMDEHS